MTLVITVPLGQAFHSVSQSHVILLEPQRFILFSFSPILEDHLQNAKQQKPPRSERGHPQETLVHRSPFDPGAETSVITPEMSHNPFTTTASHSRPREIERNDVKT